MSHGKTNINSTQPWGLITRRGTRLLCADGKIRSVSHIASTPDTFFSIPASVRVNGKTVTGYATTEEQTWIKGVNEKEFKCAFVFRKHTNGKNQHLLPQWPSELDENVKFNALIEIAHKP